MTDLLDVPNDPDKWLQTISISHSSFQSLSSQNISELVNRINTYRLLLITTQDSYQLHLFNLWDDILKGRIIIVVDNTMCSVCYIDSIATFGYYPNSNSQLKVADKTLFAETFFKSLKMTKNISISIALASEIAVSGNEENFELGKADLSTFDPLINAISLIRNNSPSGFTNAMDPYLAQIAKCEYVVEQAAIYAIRGDSVLIVKKPEHKGIRPGLLYLPGGKMEVSESPIDCARRELQEETSLRGEEFHLLGVALFPDPKDLNKLHRFYQFVVCDPIGTAIARDDIISSEWIPLSCINKSKLFEFTWAGLYIGRLFGIF